MSKIYTKLTVIVLQLVLAVAVLAMSSYAWMVLAGNPAAEGIQITIGGGNTILVAADVSKTVDGVTYHYPAAFSDTLNFSKYDDYDYLQSVGALTPVSTADGINWFIPEYYDPSDPEVESGAVLTGTMKPIDKFYQDLFLEHANLPADQEKMIEKGNYIYLDFWVVSPGEDYTLRISTGDDSGGSFVMDLPEAMSAGDGYTLSGSGNGAAACVRVGLLANPDQLVDDTMLHYQNSIAFNSQYHKLRGAYTEAGTGWQAYSQNYRFTIFEPNGDEHSGTSAARTGTYLVTRPIGIQDGTVGYADISDRLTVQMSSVWSQAATGSGTQLDQRFQTALLEPAFRESDVDQMTAKFYRDYLAGQVAPYVSTGRFVKNTQNLYTAAAGGTVREDYLNGGNVLAGATDDVYIVKLEKNIPQRIRMFIWLEGEDVDCVNGVSAASIALRIELAGSNMEESE